MKTGSFPERPEPKATSHGRADDRRLLHAWKGLCDLPLLPPGVSDTWLWSWAHFGIADSVKASTLKVREFGESRGFLHLTVPKWPADEGDAWDISAVAAHLLDARGLYRIPGETGFTYLLITGIQRVDRQDKERRRQLKRLGKGLVEQQSARLQQALAQTNPAAFDSDKGLRNEIAIRKAEKRLRTEAPRLQRVQEAQKSYVLWAPIQPSSPESVFSPDEYWHCRECSWLVPGLPTSGTRCECGNVHTHEVSFIDAREILRTRFVFALRDRGAAELVRLIPKAPPAKKG